MSAAYYNEIDPFKAAELRELIKADLIAPGEVDERGIEDVETKDLQGFTQCHFFAGVGVWSYALRLAGWPDDRPVWSGSCPCPSFSAAGKGEGFEDPRHLWPRWFGLIRESRPTAIFGEQADKAIGFGWLDLVQTDLEAEGYAVGATVLGAHSVGAPHRRQRLYFVADSESDNGRGEQSTRSTGSGRARLTGNGIALVGSDTGRPSRLAEQQHEPGEGLRWGPSPADDSGVGARRESSERADTNGRGSQVGRAQSRSEDRNDRNANVRSKTPELCTARDSGNSEINGREGQSLRTNGESAQRTSETSQSFHGPDSERKRNRRQAASPDNEQPQSDRSADRASGRGGASDNGSNSNGGQSSNGELQRSGSDGLFEKDCGVSDVRDTERRGFRISGSASGSSGRLEQSDETRDGADASSIRCDERRAGPGTEIQGECSERTETQARSEQSGELSRRSEGLCGTSDGLISFQSRLEGHFGDVRKWRGPGWLDPITARSVAEAGATRGFWADCDWWYGRDGKYRPIGAGLFPLVNGAPARVGRLRGYGDAIVAQVAQAFIEAYMSVRS